ncbi:uncharacterized protein LOC129968454 isoform X2 [Argiope bruennichi]|uniref:Uncharacterized protein n=1 Tax=Argiope bruennichi TaxID=94029 RepID=A0A8T0FTK0_ARGBR|nr:uncharacterized protein LOC129968454 isoform X2 [Argiope bruennichi]KAF8793538.1 hypothetical protein HNY73_005004 [Argiope bruennichi]
MEEKEDMAASSSSRGVECGVKWNCRNKRLLKKKISLMHLLKVICASQESCIDWLKSQGLIPKVVFCSTCRNKMKFERKESAVDGFVWICKECKTESPQCSTRDGSWLENKNLSLVDILLFTYLWSHGFTEVQIVKEANLEPEVVKEWNQMYIDICEAVEKKNAMNDENYGDENASKSGNISLVAAWRKKNKLKDPFLEFLKDADSL